MILDLFRLDDKVAVVTGAGRGIGAATAKALAEAGAAVACVARTREQVEATAHGIVAAGGRAIAICADVTREDDVHRIVNDTNARLGKLDILVNNAGGTGHGPTDRITEEQVIGAVKLNFLAPILLTRTAVPLMRDRGGAVINISSGYARVAHVGSIPYGGAKAALEQATRMMAMEYAPSVRVNAIRVGAIQTENMKQNLLAALPGVGAALAAWTPVGRLGVPDDIAAAVLYLAAPASSYMTGKILDVDGGLVTERSAMEIIATAERLRSGAREVEERS
ncbi:MAG: SDR family oxidoreductase [Pseudomonadales bacterium]|jgi:7-alpha-hydroxysteroid dehydrogenase|nr:SDR family oxidoreductase [Pseudomonadales bacterium]